MRFHRATIVICALAMSGCVTTNETPLSLNSVRLDTQASGLLFTGQAGKQTQLRAATLTLQKGFTHFRLEQVQTGQGSQLAGIQTYGNSGFTAPLYAPTANIGMTVIMFHADEPGAVGAFDAAKVLAEAKTS